MNGMAKFIKERVGVETRFDALMSMNPEYRASAIRNIMERAEAASTFKKHQLVRVCRHPGFSLTEGPLPHDHDNPEQHFNSRVMGWDCFGRIEVATVIGSNPHRSGWCWQEDMVHPREDVDWAETSLFKIGQKISYIWELRGFWENRALGMRVKAVLLGPHIEPGDWLVLYENSSSDWVTRVLNERQMLPLEV